MTDDTFRIRIEAKNPARKPFRSYRIDANPDLFGRWIIEVRYGKMKPAAAPKPIRQRIGKKPNRLSSSVYGEKRVRRSELGYHTAFKNCMIRRSGQRSACPNSISGKEDYQIWMQGQGG